jgi:hypothetical protein
MASLLALLSGCSCVSYRVIDVDARAKLEDRRRFVVLATTLEGRAYTDLPAAVLPLEAHYRPGPRTPGEPPWWVLPLEEAVGTSVGPALRAAREELLALGYVPATSADGPGAPDLVVLVSVTRVPATPATGPALIPRAVPRAITRVAIEVGGPLDGEFERALVSIDATPDEGCEVVAEELVREMVGALPGPGDEKDAEQLEEKER